MSFELHVRAKEFVVVGLKIDEEVLIDIGLDLGTDRAEAVGDCRDCGRTGADKRVVNDIAFLGASGVKPAPHVIGFGESMTEFFGYGFARGGKDAGSLNTSEDGCRFPANHCELHRLGEVMIGSCVALSGGVHLVPDAGPRLNGETGFPAGGLKALLIVDVIPEDEEAMFLDGLESQREKAKQLTQGIFFGLLSDAFCHDTGAIVVMGVEDVSGDRVIRVADDMVAEAGRLLFHEGVGVNVAKGRGQGDDEFLCGLLHDWGFACCVRIRGPLLPLVGINDFESLSISSFCKSRGLRHRAGNCDAGQLISLGFHVSR